MLLPFATSIFANKSLRQSNDKKLRAKLPCGVKTWHAPVQSRSSTAICMYLRSVLLALATVAKRLGSLFYLFIFLITQKVFNSFKAQVTKLVRRVKIWNITREASISSDMSPAQSSLTHGRHLGSRSTDVSNQSGNQSTFHVQTVK